MRIKESFSAQMWGFPICQIYKNDLNAGHRTSLLLRAVMVFEEILFFDMEIPIIRNRSMVPTLVLF